MACLQLPSRSFPGPWKKTWPRPANIWISRVGTSIPPNEKRDLLARIGAEVRSRQMPLPRYVLLHPEARLSDAEIQAIYEWTKAQRRALRNQRE